MQQKEFTKRQLIVLESIRQQKLLPNITYCDNCRKRIDIEKDNFIFGDNYKDSINETYIYCCQSCASWHFSILMY